MILIVLFVGGNHVMSEVTCSSEKVNMVWRCEIVQRKRITDDDKKAIAMVVGLVDDENCQCCRPDRFLKKIVTNLHWSKLFGRFIENVNKKI
jgi:hypothetical protein